MESGRRSHAGGHLALPAGTLEGGREALRGRGHSRAPRGPGSRVGSFVVLGASCVK